MAELIATIDMREKTGTGRIVEEAVPLTIEGKRFEFFMTNDYEAICGKMKSLGYWQPTAFELKPNPTLDKRICNKMLELGATWSVTVTDEAGLVSYHDETAGAFFSIFLRGISARMDRGTCPRSFVLAADDKGDELEALIREGADINERIDSGMPLLTVAALKNACSSLRTLLKMGADVNAADSEGMTALISAVLEHNVEAVKILLSAPGIDLEAKDSISGSTALLFAALYDYADICTLLVEAGADMNVTNVMGRTPLSSAIATRAQTDGKAADYLIRAGADLDIPDKEGRTALSLAAECGKTGIVTRLLDAGADDRHKDTKGMCAFSWAVCGGHADTLAVFMERNLFPEEELGKALTEAGFRGFADSTDVLIRMSEPAETAAYFALMGACVQDCADAARVCLQYPCNVNMPSEFGMTPLMLACYCGSMEVAQLLVAHGADVNAADEEGMTALMYAAVKHDARMMFFLIGRGADKSAKSAEGKDAGDYFGESDARDIGELIADRTKAKASSAGSTADIGAGTAFAGSGTAGSPEASPTVPAGHKSFGETFDFYMKKYFERFPDKKNSDIYKAVGLDKRRFSKILSSRNDPNYHPRKENVTALAMGLKLSLAESEDLLQSAGFILSPRDKADMKIQSFFATGNYNIFDLNNSIYESTGRLFFKSMTAGED